MRYKVIWPSLLLKPGQSSLLPLETWVYYGHKNYLSFPSWNPSFSILSSIKICWPPYFLSSISAFRILYSDFNGRKIMRLFFVIFFFPEMSTLHCLVLVYSKNYTEIYHQNIGGYEIQNKWTYKYLFYESIYGAGSSIEISWPLYFVLLSFCLWYQHLEFCFRILMRINNMAVFSWSKWKWLKSYGFPDFWKRKLIFPIIPQWTRVLKKKH